MFDRRFKLSNRVNSLVLLWLVVLFPLAGPTLGIAQDYPTKPIIINVGFTPGSGAGNSAQIFADNAKKYLPKSQPILLNFKPGAATAIAADYVLKQPADGYNLMWMLPDLMIKLAMDSSLSFTKEDFIPIGLIGESPCLLTVKKESPFEKFEDFLETAKKNPGKISYASTGIGSGNHLMGEWIQVKCGIKLKHIPFGGGVAGISATLGGHVDSFIGMSVAGHGAHIKPGGGLRVLAVFARERWPEFPEVPTCLEKGYDIVRSAWFSLAAPRATPQSILDILQKVFKKTADDPQVKEALTNMGYKPLNLGPEESAKKYSEEFELTRLVFKK